MIVGASEMSLLVNLNACEQLRCIEIKCHMNILPLDIDNFHVVVVDSAHVGKFGECEILKCGSGFWRVHFCW